MTAVARGHVPRTPPPTLPVPSRGLVFSLIILSVKGVAVSGGRHGHAQTTADAGRSAFRGSTAPVATGTAGPRRLPFDHPPHGVQHPARNRGAARGARLDAVDHASCSASRTVASSRRRRRRWSVHGSESHSRTVCLVFRQRAFARATGKKNKPDGPRCTPTADRHRLTAEKPIVLFPPLHLVRCDSLDTRRCGRVPERDPTAAACGIAPVGDYNVNEEPG